MRVNEDIIDVLKSCNLSVNDCMPYLIALHYGYKPSYIPEEITKKVNATGIVKPGKGTEGLVWTIPLFEGQSTEFDWVDKWVKLFADVNPDRRGNGRYAKKRMKDFFARHPQYRKDDVIAATKMYIRSVDDPQYLMKAHNFIKKGQGLNAQEELLEWCERYEKVKEFDKLNNTDSTNMMRR